MNTSYLDTARLLVRVAPVVLDDGTFALKGGTAINLFVRQMPRLSIDLDLVYLDHSSSHDEALVQIRESLRAAVPRLSRMGIVSIVHDDSEVRLFARVGRVEVKAEVTPVMRGTLHPPRLMSLTAAAEAVLQAEIQVPVVSFEDLYGGKLAAAMDRQHPRDLFDVMQLFEHEGITPGVRRAFLVYVACHRRPLHEVLFPRLRDVATEHAREFAGMTTETVTVEHLLKTRQRMIDELQQELGANERQFLLSIARNRPEWSLLGLDSVETLPALRWKLANLDALEKRNPEKFAAQYDALARRLDAL